MKKMMSTELSNSEYHADPAISKSGLDLVHKAPAVYWDQKLNPRAEKHETPAMRLGSMIHMRVLERELFGSTYAHAPAVDRRTKAGKEAWQSFIDANIGKQIMTDDEGILVEKIGRAVDKSPIASSLLDGAEIESSFFWDDNGLACKCRADAIRSDGVVIDLKTTTDASPRGFLRSVMNFRYHVQAAYYLDGISRFQEANSFVLIAVEKTAPFLVGVYLMPQQLVDLGRHEYRKDLETFRQCQAADQWPGLPDEIQVLDVPGWIDGSGD